MQRKISAILVSLLLALMVFSGSILAEEIKEPVSAEDVGVEAQEEPAATEQDVDPEVQAQDQSPIIYAAHVSDIGWMDAVGNGGTAGTTGQSKGLECLRVEAPGLPEDSDIEYQAHVQNIGWQGYRKDGEDAGTTGQGLSLQAMQLRLTGSATELYDLYYRMHVSNLGWLDWASNDGVAGSSGLNYPAEAIEIVLTPKGSPAPGETAMPYVSKDLMNEWGQVHYISYMGNIGWLEAKANGADSGVPGGATAVEGLVASLPIFPGGGIQYQAHIADVGWEGWKRDADQAGQPGSGRQMEAFQVELYGNAQKLYDVYYQAYSNGLGWLDWAKNGKYAGTANGNRRVEALRIKLVPKGDPAPGKTLVPFIDAPPKSGQYFNGEGVYVNIPQQLLFYFNGQGQLALWTPVTTGTLGVYDTPTGYYHLLRKSRDVTLRGSDYSSHVSYWLPYIGQEYGLHDADEWRSNYGGDYYTYDGSHGCVNVPFQAIATLYQMINIGCPIVIE